MPNWKLHNDWASKLGIERKVANWVNKREDRHKIDVSATMNKDIQSSLASMPDTPPTYNEMTKLGDDYLRAWILHLILDEIEDTYEYLLGKIKKKNSDNIQNEIMLTVTENPFYRLVPDDMQGFITENAKTIIQEIKDSNPKIAIYGI